TEQTPGTWEGLAERKGQGRRKLEREEKGMFARVVMNQSDSPLDSAQMQEALRQVQDQNYPLMKRQKGFKAAYVMTAPQGKTLSVSFWETEEDARAASEALDALLRQQGEQQPEIPRPTSGEIYEVRIQ